MEVPGIPPAQGPLQAPPPLIAVTIARRHAAIGWRPDPTMQPGRAHPPPSAHWPAPIPALANQRLGAPSFPRSGPRPTANQRPNRRDGSASCVLFTSPPCAFPSFAMALAALLSLATAPNRTVCRDGHGSRFPPTPLCDGTFSASAGTGRRPDRLGETCRERFCSLVSALVGLPAFASRVISSLSHTSPSRSQTIPLPPSTTALVFFSTQVRKRARKRQHR